MYLGSRFLKIREHDCGYREREALLSQLVIEIFAPNVNKLSVLSETYSDIFVSGPNDPLGRTTRAEHSIDTGDSRSVKYRIPVHLNKVVNRQVNDMLGRGLIRPSNSP